MGPDRCSELDSIPWASLPQPSWNGPTAVPDAIRRLAALKTGEDARRAYDDFLYAVGNNHAGTYFPVVLHTLPFLEEILRSPPGLAQQTTLDVLVDLLGSFAPDPGHQVVGTSTGKSVALQKLVREGVARFADVIATLARSGSPEAPTRRLAEALLECLSETP